MNLRKALSSSCVTRIILLVGAVLLPFLLFPAWGDETHASGAHDKKSQPTLSLAEVISAVCASNPSIQAARKRWQAMKARVPQAAAWEDLTIETDSIARRFIKVAPDSFTDQTVMVEQELPISGRNRSRARAATAEAGAAFEDSRRIELDVVSRARAAYYRLANEYAQLEVNRKNEVLLNQFTEISRAKFEVGNVTGGDVVTAQTDAARLVEARLDILRRISDAQSTINVLMGRPAQSPLGRPVSLSFEAVGLSLETLQSLALKARPEVQRACNQIEVERFRLQLANRQWVPDPKVNIKAQRYNDASQAISEIDVGVSLNLPSLNRRKYSAGIVEAQMNLEAAQRDFEAARNETLGMVRDQVQKIETFAHHYKLYRDKILPLAQQTVRSNRAAYETNNTGFPELITAQRVLLDVESTYLNHLADYQIGLAEIEAIIGISNSFNSVKRTGGKIKSK